MDVYHICKFVDSSVLNHQYAHLLNDISGMGTISVTAENKAIYLIFLYLSWFRMTNKQFQHAFRFIHSHCFAVGTPERLFTYIGDTLHLKLILCRAHTGCFWLSKDSGRHNVKADAISLTQDMIHGMHGLHLCCMKLFCLDFDEVSYKNIESLYRTMDQPTIDYFTIILAVCCVYC